MFLVSFIISEEEVQAFCFSFPVKTLFSEENGNSFLYLAKSIKCKSGLDKTCLDM